MTSRFIPIASVALALALLHVLSPARGLDAVAGRSPQFRTFFDLTRPEEARLWLPEHDVSRIEPSREGMRVHISGPDPYIHGPAREMPAGGPVWLNLKLKSDDGGMGQVFFFTSGAREEDSVRFPIRARRWESIRVPLPSLRPGTRFRIDPPGSSGRCLIAFLSVEPRGLIAPPAWLAPTGELSPKPRLTNSGSVELAHDRNVFGGFQLRVAQETMAAGHDRPLIGYEMNGKIRWIDVRKAGKTSTGPTSGKRGTGVDVRCTFTDPDGARWELRQQFLPGVIRNSIGVTILVTVNRNRSVINLPLLTLLPGLASFGKAKGQGLFSGLEYLEDEPSSSKKDLEGPESARRVPDTVKITLPLMAVQARDRYVGLVWEPSSQISALFDSPDRIFQSGAHVMGLLFPGSNGADREDGALLPYHGAELRANTPLLLRATIIGGKGKSVVPAIQHYVRLRGLPPVPTKGVEASSYMNQISAGWLDSKIREGGLFRHAWPGGFGLGPAADSVVFMQWLATRTRDSVLVARLEEASELALLEAPPAEYYGSGVSHVRFPVAPLIRGVVEAGIARASEHARAQLRRFEPNGTVPFRQSPGGLDYARTHSAPDANGLTAQVVASLLEAAAFGGDRELIDAGIEKLRALDRFVHTVPRGAQTWEIPLHTPDILASAYLVRAYTLGYELTSERRFLDYARYWAWTGVPFVYLVPPTNEPVGIYATIAVLGATQWKAPVWMGLPVQWCGLVYADALYRLVRHDAAGPWKRLADGITASGVQQSWPTGGTDQQSVERQGLLPDSFTLRAQVRNDAAINPGTLQANAVRLFGGPDIYDFRAFRRSGVLIHAPGTIVAPSEKDGSLSFSIRAWSQEPYNILAVRLSRRPHVFVDGKEVSAGRYDEKQGRFILTVAGSPNIEIRLR